MIMRPHGTSLRSCTLARRDRDRHGVGCGGGKHRFLGFAIDGARRRGGTASGRRTGHRRGRFDDLGALSGRRIDRSGGGGHTRCSQSFRAVRRHCRHRWPRRGVDRCRWQTASAVSHWQPFGRKLLASIGRAARGDAGCQCNVGASLHLADADTAVGRTVTASRALLARGELSSRLQEQPIDRVGRFVDIRIAERFEKFVEDAVV